MRRRSKEGEEDSLSRPNRMSRGRRRSRIQPMRSNSISALGCSRQACVAATASLSEAYRLPIDEPLLPILDNLPVGTRNEQQVAASTMTAAFRLSRHPALLDLPLKTVHISGADRWNFDILSLKRHSSSEVVCSMGMHLMEQHQLFETLRLDRSSVFQALAAIESVYWTHNPYHTALHAADVAQAIHCFISQPTLRRLLSPAEIFGSIFAALCHDADHPGCNQPYLERTGHFMVDLYNANSVLEQHHARVGLSILHQSGISKQMSASNWDVVRNCVVKMVHATDMAHQENYRGQFTSLLERRKNQPDYAFSSAERLLLLQMSIKCADISNPCRPWQACRYWAYRVCAEFFSQGDQERLRWSLTPTAGCDRNGSSIPVIQIAFINKLLRPLFIKWNDFFQTALTAEVVKTLDENYRTWQQRLLSPMDQPVGDHGTTAARVHDQPPSVANPPIVKALGHLGKGRLFSAGKPLEAKAVKNQTFNVTFDLNDTELSSQNRTACKDKDSSPRSGLHTFFITTRGLRRHSLPETQGAIKKTFNFALSKKPTPSVTTTSSVAGSSDASEVNFNNTVTPTGSGAISRFFGSPSSVHYLYVNRPSAQSLRTPSGNILQTLCEEICSQESGSKSRASELPPFPLPDAWTQGTPTTTTTLNASAQGPTTADCPVSCLTGVAINLSVSDFIALANRRSSVPLIEK